MEYTVDYFIQKFEAIPEDNWITNTYFDPNIGCCALGWCGQRSSAFMCGHHLGRTEESNALINLFLNIVPVNDGKHKDYPQPTPKQRVLAALYDIKNGHAHALPKKD